jgi:hypothetical protein
MLERVASDLVSQSWLSIGPLVNGFGGHCTPVIVHCVDRALPRKLLREQFLEEAVR